MSSSLFVLAMDILSKKLDLAVRADRFIPHPRCHVPLVTHLSFADDVLIFFDGSERSVEGILEVLNSFYLDSGLQLSLAKSRIFLDGNNQSLIASLASTFQITLGSFPVRYLGLPLLPHKMRPRDFQPLLDKVRFRFTSWSNRHLSYAGRLQLIQSVIYELERLCSSFLWKGEAGTARGARVSWDSICTPKKCGGLGLRRLVAWNRVFTLKLIWLLYTKAGSLWVSWVTNNLINGRNFWDITYSADGSWI